MLCKHHYVSEKHIYSVTTISSCTVSSSGAYPPTHHHAMVIIDKKFIYLGNSIFINLDMQINYEPQEMPAKPHSTSISDQLGQVGYTFSEKTSTLTQHFMAFKKCCINAII
ncbi:hypothetical protein QTO34_015836 [Cnephaeus nilssonii]|uniref:Uncharacterized protein n=1 Tax=Cnephaeus nilssonii TaxID=3371016 RepID=A0AA40LTI7_CNENI|nr:hypothetical protein QTO34_015836 [Eptesicus nilssonii]